MPSRTARLPAYTLVAFAAAGLAAERAPAQELRSFSLSFDNDGFVFWHAPSRRSDYYYTHGMRLEAHLAHAPPLVDRPVCGGRAPTGDGCVLTRVSLGHQIYTPENVFSDDPPIDDHPYGGFLYAEVAGSLVEASGLTEVGLRIGVTGAPSLGQYAHQGFHRWLDKAEPTGWQHQIPFEVAFAVTAHRTELWAPLPSAWPISLAVLPRWGGALGTLRSSADAGLGLRIAWNSRPASEWGTERPGDGLHVVGEVSATGEFVFRDLFLDGSTFGESVNTDRSTWVGRRRGRLQVGVGALALEFAATRVSPRFRAQQGDHTYGTIRFRVRP